MRRLETEFTFQGLKFEVVGELPMLPKKNRVYILGTEEYIWNGTSFDMIGKYRDLGNAKVEETLRKVEELDEPSHPTNCKNCGRVVHEEEI